MRDQFLRGAATASTKFAVDVRDVAMMEQILHALVPAGQKMPVPLGSITGLHSGMTDTGDSPIARGLLTGAGMHFGDRAGQAVGGTVGGLVGTGAGMLARGLGAGPHAGGNIYNFSSLLGKALGGYVGAQEGAHAGQAFADRNKPKPEPKKPEVEKKSALDEFFLKEAAGFGAKSMGTMMRQQALNDAFRAAPRQGPQMPVARQVPMVQMAQQSGGRNIALPGANAPSLELDMTPKQFAYGYKGGSEKQAFTLFDLISHGVMGAAWGNATSNPEHQLLGTTLGALGGMGGMVGGALTPTIPGNGTPSIIANAMRPVAGAVAGGALGGAATRLLPRHEEEKGAADASASFGLQKEAIAPLLGLAARAVPWMARTAVPWLAKNLGKGALVNGGISAGTSLAQGQGVGQSLASGVVGAGAGMIKNPVLSAGANMAGGMAVDKLMGPKASMGNGLN